MDLTGLKSRCQQCCVLSGGSREEFVFMPFPAFSGCPHSLAYGLLPFSKPTMTYQVCLTSHHSGADSSVPSFTYTDSFFPTYKAPSFFLVWWLTGMRNSKWPGDSISFHFNGTVGVYLGGSLTPVGSKAFIATEPKGKRTGSKIFTSGLLEIILRGSHFHFHPLIFKLINAGWHRFRSYSIT